MNRTNTLSAIALVLASLGFFASARASGVIAVHGTLLSITESEYVVSTPHSDYYIYKTAVGTDVAKKIDRPGKEITLSVPFDGIEKIKPHPRQTAHK